MNEKRTTIHLAADVEEFLRSEAAEKSLSFKQIVNDYLRLGMKAASKKIGKKKFKVKARSLGQLPGINYDNISELLEIAEGPEHK